ncbi:MAG: hypothetical protein C5B58_05935 [Acidobacteria bacterium]|nr:MAG: hypothetical protein C5B58_05935 [Acidobacteriota bacterium]
MHGDPKERASQTASAESTKSRRRSRGNANFQVCCAKGSKTGNCRNAAHDDEESPPILFIMDQTFGFAAPTTGYEVLRCSLAWPDLFFQWSEPEKPEVRM